MPSFLALSFSWLLWRQNRSERQPVSPSVYRVWDLLVNRAIRSASAPASASASAAASDRECACEHVLDLSIFACRLFPARFVLRRTYCIIAFTYSHGIVSILVLRDLFYGVLTIFSHSHIYTAFCQYWSSQIYFTAFLLCSFNIGPPRFVFRHSHRIAFYQSWSSEVCLKTFLL